MKEETRILIMYRLERARESFEEAGILLEHGYANTVVNRLYYACFYAVTALLLTRGLSSSKHSGIRSLFHQIFVKSGQIDPELGQLFDSHSSTGKPAVLMAGKPAVLVAGKPVVFCEGG